MSLKRMKAVFTFFIGVIVATLVLLLEFLVACYSDVVTDRQHNVSIHRMETHEAISTLSLMNTDIIWGPL